MTNRNGRITPISRNTGRTERHLPSDGIPSQANDNVKSNNRWVATVIVLMVSTLFVVAVAIIKMGN